MRGTKGFVTSVLLAGVIVMVFAGPASATINKSSFFAGYDATATTPFTSFSGSVITPTVTCPAAAQVSMDMDITLGSASGTAYFVTSFFCNNGSVQFGEAYVSPCFPNAATCPQGYVLFKPGDTVHFKLAESASTGYTTLTVTNATQQEIGSAAVHQLPSFTSVKAGTSFGTSGNVTPIPSFTGVKFSALNFGGALLSALSPSEFEMYDGTVLQVATSAISSTGGFSNVFKHV
jgi:hypothetical protein